MLILAHLALAAPIFLTASSGTQLDVDGNWPRAFPADGGWWVTNAAGGEYNLQFVLDDLTPDRSSRRVLTSKGHLQDHAITQCPDGTFLHTASSSTTENDDTAYIFRYDADFNLLDEGVVAESDTAGIYADLPIICSEDFVGVAYWADEAGRDFRYVPINDDLSVGTPADLDDCTLSMGAAMFEDEGLLKVLGFGGKDGGLLVSDYDSSFATVDSREIPVAMAGWTAYWSQGIMRVGDTYLVAHMESEDKYSWTTQQGDFFVSAFDLDWNLIESMQLSHNTAPVGGTQPGFALKDDKLLVMYSLNLKNWAYEVTIDLAAAGVEEEDTGTVDTGTEDTGTEDTATVDTGPTDSGPDDSATTDTGSDSAATDDSGSETDTANGKTDDGGCGCNDGAAVAAFLPSLLALFASTRRRRTR